ncbi:MAG: hypothetical protein FJX66_05635 [Alphaproteobacteria bacterium]|nr:hypothetical protein [Alphaproteobacteria bacterium]
MRGRSEERDAATGGAVSAPKVYLAGPDIFLANAKDVAAWQKDVCLRHGLTPLHPMDNNLDLSGDPAALAMRIYQADVGQMVEADAICANMNDFIGADPDSGTCFEVGFFAGFNMALRLLKATKPEKPIYGHVDAADTYEERIARWRAGQSSTKDLERWRFSTIDMHINLMMEMAMASSGAFITAGFEACVARIAADWRTGRFAAPSR